MLIDPITSGDSEEKKLPDTYEGRLVGWVMSNVDAWRNHRDSNHKAEWDEYYRVWRAKWSEEDRTRKSERSKIITPATMQAVDSTVAEIQEAVFGREAWIDLDEDVKEQMEFEQRQEWIEKRDLLLEKAAKARVPQSISKSVLIGSIWGTGLGKVDTQVKKCRKIVKSEAGTAEAQEYEEVSVRVIPMEPYEFIPDPTTDCIDEMLGCAHETVVPLHQVREKIRDGAYFKDAKIDGYSGEDMPQGPKLASQTRPVAGRGVWIVEWHGKVPAKYLLPIIDDKMPPEVRDSMDALDEEDQLVEAIVTIGNKSVLLGAKRNPFLMQDRCIVGYQHDTVPGYFWGRGVPEKASNSQRTLDATVRARIDAMGFTSSPMFAGDVTRLPRGFNLTVYPGKFWPTTGSPSEILQPLSMGQVNPDLYSHAQDMERMISSATGAMDPSASYSPNGQSATNTALNSSAFIKRAKLAVRNVDSNFVSPIVEKMMWRYMQFCPDEFNPDYEFTTRTALGIMAREFEQQQLLQMLSVVPNEQPIFYAVMKAIFESSGSPHKAAVMQAVNQVLNPPPKTPEQEAAEKAQLELEQRGKEAAVADLEAKAEKSQAEALRSKALALKAMKEAELMEKDIAIDEERLDLEHMDRVLEMRSTAALEQQNAQTDIANDIRAQALALNIIKEGLSATDVLSQSDVLLNSAKSKVTV